MTKNRRFFRINIGGFWKECQDFLGPIFKDFKKSIMTHNCGFVKTNNRGFVKTNNRGILRALFGDIVKSVNTYIRGFFISRIVDFSRPIFGDFGKSVARLISVDFSRPIIVDFQGRHLGTSKRFITNI